jgi:hypothetical protein
VRVNVFQRLGHALESLWSAVDPDEPLFCDCQATTLCADCALAAPVEPIQDWSITAAT